MEFRLQRGRNLTKIDAVKLIKRNMDLVLSFNNSANLLTDARQIIDKTKELAFRSVNVAMLFKLFPNNFPTLSGQSKLLSKRLSNKKPYICFSRANDFLTSIKR